MPKGRTRQTRSGGKRSERASISFPSDVYKTLDEIAKRKKVSLAWVVREAAEKYIAEMWPLFAKQKE